MEKRCQNPEHPTPAEICGMQHQFGMKVCRDLLWAADGQYKVDKTTRERAQSIGVSKVIPFWKRIKQEYGLEPKAVDPDIHPADRGEQDAGCVPNDFPRLNTTAGGERKGEIVSPRHKRTNPETGEVEVVDRVVVKKQSLFSGKDGEQSMCAQQ